MKEKGKEPVDLNAALDRWVLKGVERGKNKRIKSNDLMTVFCTKCHDFRNVREGKESRNAICEKCGIQMVEKYHYDLEMNRMKSNKDK